MIKLGEVIIPQIKHIKTNILGYNGKQAKKSDVPVNWHQIT